jgi:hypothetical protein
MKTTVGNRDYDITLPQDFAEALAQGVIDAEYIGEDDGADEWRVWVTKAELPNES